MFCVGNEKNCFLWARARWNLTRTGSWHFALPRQRLDPCEGWKCSHLYQHQTPARPNVGGFWFFLQCWTHFQPFLISINSQTRSGSDWRMCEGKSAHLNQNNSSLNGLGGGRTFPDTLKTPSPSHKSLSGRALCAPSLCTAFGITLSGYHFYCCPTPDGWLGHQSCQEMMVCIELLHLFSSLCPAFSSLLQ